MSTSTDQTIHEFEELASSSMMHPEPIDLDLLDGESVIWTEKHVAYNGPFGKCPGKLVITRYRLVFLVEENGKNFENWKIGIPLGHVSKVQKIGKRSKRDPTKVEGNYGFAVHCKDYRIYNFSCFPSSNRKHFCDSMNRYSFPTSHQLSLFAFAHFEESPKAIEDGWKIYSPEKEYARLGITKSSGWSIVDLNKDYKYSKTYPRVFVIPTTSCEKGKPFMKKVGKFRSKERIPVLSWIDQTTQASITRCAQPMTGLSGKRSVEDEEHLNNIMAANPHSRELLIVDARPLINARVMKAKGGGFEENYPNAPLIFLNIQNIHVVRDSLKKIVHLLIPSVDEKHFYKSLDDSKWLNHIQSILEGAARVVYNVETEKQSVLVHCSDGWDRTAQLTSVAMIQLDPYYRTIEGFIVLVEKEWCSFGHKFGDRIGHGIDAHGDGERSPIFVQFCDCLWQILRQFPSEFEYNQDLLIQTLDELYSCRYGTFLYNSEKIRIHDHKCHEKTVSFWTYILENKKKFKNPLYFPKNKVLNVNSSLCALQLWTDYFARPNPHVITADHKEMQHTGYDFIDEKKQLLNDIMLLEDEAVE